MRAVIIAAFICISAIVTQVLSQAPGIPPQPGQPPMPGQPPAVGQPGIPLPDVTPTEGIDPTNRSAYGYKSEILEGFYEEFVYNQEDRRDPFSPFQPKINFSPIPITHPLQRFQLDQLKIIGIIWNNTSPKALVLDPGGTSYVVLENDRIGNSNGYIAKIREGEVVVVEEHMDVAGNKAYLTKLLPFRKN